MMSLTSRGLKLSDQASPGMVKAEGKLRRYAASRDSLSALGVKTT